MRESTMDLSGWTDFYLSRPGNEEQVQDSVNNLESTIAASNFPKKLGRFDKRLLQLHVSCIGNYIAQLGHLKDMTLWQDLPMVTQLTS